MAVDSNLGVPLVVIAVIAVDPAITDLQMPLPMAEVAVEVATDAVTMVVQAHRIVMEACQWVLQREVGMIRVVDAHMMTDPAASVEAVEVMIPEEVVEVTWSR